MANRLAHESSPYLLQHKDNPVDWYPWGDEALARARSEDRPIMLSIGYSACHWCHVMERESFEDPATASLINAHFVAVKVDREERPDLDSIYMEAVQRLTGSGGWPMTVFLTPDGRPFFGGTYFPPEPRHGLPGFKMLLEAVADAYRDRRADLERDATQIAQSLGTTVGTAIGDELSDDLVPRAARAIAAAYDGQYGGFGRAPKFPQPMALELLLRAHRRGVSRSLQMAEQTLLKMARGGIYDQLGGGFHRYSVDGMWLVPHFEKMLYDNAQLARVYTNAYQATANPLYRTIAEETLRYVQREMTSPEGGFYSTQDADSEGHEGKFFVWDEDEIQQLLGDDAEPFARVYGVTPGGNFEGRNILHRAREPRDVATDFGMDLSALEILLARGRVTLFQARESRVRPARDEKVLTAWNGLMLRAFATAAAAFDDDSFRRTAEQSALFVLSALRQGDRLLRSYKDGAARLNGYLEDYAFLADGLLALYETSGQERWLRDAQTLAEILIDRFADPEGGPFFGTSSDHEQLIGRPRDLYDNAVPSGNSVAAELLLGLAVHTGEERYREHAIRAILPLQDAMASAPLGFGRLLCAADMAAEPSRELAIIGEPSAPDTRALLRVPHARFDPNLVIAVATPAQAESSRAPLFQGRRQLGAKATAYLCERYVCREPVTEPEVLARLLSG